MELDHITIRTSDLEGTRKFLLKVFDELEEKERPKLIQRIPGFWLYDGNRPLIHIIQGYGINQGGYFVHHGSFNGLDHVGIKLKNYHQFKQKLINLDIPHSTMDLEEIQERRIFFEIPDGVLIETVFNESIT